MSKESIFCISCGAANPPEARFCYKCGATMHGTNAGSFPSAKVKKADRRAETQNLKPKESKPRLFSKTETIVWIVVAALVYLGLTTSGILYCQAKGISPYNFVDKYQSANADQALTNALARFDTYQSYTIHTVSVETHIYNDTTSVTNLDIVEKVNLVNRVSLARETNTEYETSSELFCNSEGEFALDTTGLFKPTPWACSVNNLRIGYLKLELADIRAGNFSYIGEEPIGGAQAKKYELTLTADQLTNPDLEYTVTMTNPVVTFYVGADGDLLRMEYSIDKLESDSGTQFSYLATSDFSDWNATSFTAPELVSRQDTELQTYTSSAASGLTFDFPKVDRLDSVEEYICLSGPDGGLMYLSLQGLEMSILGNFSYTLLKDPDLALASTCDGFSQDFLPGWTLPSGSVLTSSTLIRGSQLNFCQSVYQTDNGKRAFYLFVEPIEMATANGRSLPYAYIISIFPTKDQEPAMLFLDAITTFRFK